MSDYHDEVTEVDGTVYRFSSDWTKRLETEDHWRLYWQQQRLMEELVKRGDDLLEIGVGSGFAANYLRSRGVRVTTLDIDAGKNPDIHANLVTYQFRQSFDHIAAFEVFEHLPFVELPALVGKLARVCRRNLFVSVPRNERSLFSCEFWLPKVGRRRVELKTLRGQIHQRHHFWELDHGEASAARFEEMFLEAGFRKLAYAKKFSCCYYVFENAGPSGPGGE